MRRGARRRALRGLTRRLAPAADEEPASWRNRFVETGIGPVRSDRRELLLAVDRVCREHGITRKPTRPSRPWTKGRAERRNRTIKKATVKGFPDETPGRARRPTSWPSSRPATAQSARSGYNGELRSRQSATP